MGTVSPCDALDMQRENPDLRCVSRDVEEKRGSGDISHN